MKENPSGRNTFGRSFDEQRKYEADEEEAQEKEVAAAREELQGWPKVIGLYPFILSVNGTNVLQTVNGCLDGVIGRHWVNDDTTTFDLSSLLEKECHIVVARGGGRNWECGKGTSLILEPQLGANFWHKYDETGRLVKVGGWAQFAEYDFLTNRRAIVSNRLRAEWAKKHGLTLPQAEKRAQELIEVIGTSTTGDRRDWLAARRRMRAQLAQEERAKATAGASEREAERQSQAEAEKAQCDAERAEQRQQLQAIREKLNRVREAKAAEE